MSKNYLNQAGSFECVVDHPEEGWLAESSKKQTPYVRIPVTVAEGPCKGQITVVKVWLSNDAFDNSVKRLNEVFGWDGDMNKLAQKGSRVFSGLPCNIETEMTTYEGKPRMEVSWLNAPGGGGGGVKPLEDAKAASLVKAMNARAKAVAANAAKERAANGGVPARKSFEEIVDGEPGGFENADVPS